MSIVDYDEDVLLWSEQQARLLRSGDFSRLDIEHLADEIEDVGKAEQRELVSRLAVLIGHLLKWRFQPERRGNSWRGTIRNQRTRIALVMKRTPSLRRLLHDPEWATEAWLSGLEVAAKDMGIEEGELPQENPWTMDRIIDPDFWPD